MKYLFIINSLSHGGAERSVSVLSSALVHQGQEVCILKCHADKEEYTIDKKVRVVCFSKSQSEYLQSSRIKRILFIRKTIREEHPDFVIPYMIYVALATEIAAVGLKVNIFQTIRNNPAAFPPGKGYRLIRNWMVARSKCTFTQNEAQKLYFHRKLHHRIHVVFNPVDERFFNVPRRMGLRSFLFCAAGRLTEQKNFGLLIRSFAKAFGKEEKVKLVIYGEGHLKELLQQLIDGEGCTSRILLPGRTNDMAEAYAQADAFVLSSDFEGMPNALIEAMASGVPSISTDCPTGPSDLIDDHLNGILVPVRDEDAMAAAMRNIYEDKNLRDMLSIQGRKKIKDVCSAERIARQFIEICEEHECRPRQ